MSSPGAMMRLTTCDALVSDNVVHAIIKVSPLTITLRSLSEPEATVSLSHTEVLELIKANTFTVEYGYFSDRAAARRALGGRTLITRLSEKTRLVVYRKEIWCSAFLLLEAEGKVNRSARRWKEFLPLLVEQVRETLLSQKSVLQDACSQFFEIRRPPCRTSLMSWIRKFEGTKDPAVFIKRSSFNGPNACRIDSEREAIIQRNLAGYEHPNRISAKQLHHDVNSEIRRRNELIQNSRGVKTRSVSLSTVRRRLRELDAFETTAARKGLAFAKNKFGPHSGGLQVSAPLERVEMDEWKIDLMAILGAGEIDVTGPQFRELEIGRYWVCAAMDVATRSLLGIKLSLEPSVADAKEVLWMAMQDKTKLGKQLGCETAWIQHGHVNHVAVDNGASFVSSDFKAAVSDLNIDYSVLPAGVPHLRARVERLFGTLATMLMPLLTGRTFANSQERGDYPSHTYAVHTAKSIIEFLIRFSVDVYHNRPHLGLMSASPNSAWTKLIQQYGWPPPQSPHTLRHILGIPLMRETGRHGVLVNGVNYHSMRLIEHFQKVGGQKVEIRIDPENVGHISVWLDTGEEAGWSTLTASVAGLEGVSHAEWERTIFEIRKDNRDALSLTQGVIDRAIERIKKIDEEQRARRQIGPIAHTREQIERAQRETFWGLSLGSAVDGTSTSGGSEDRRNQGVLSNDVPAASAAGTSLQTMDGSEKSGKTVFWSFYKEEKSPDDEESSK